jgi:dual oxidase maturation factor 1
MRGWFDLFRDNGGPTLYAYSNRTSVIGDVQAITLYIAFTTLLIAFIIIFPGIRREVCSLRVLKMFYNIKYNSNLEWF